MGNQDRAGQVQNKDMVSMRGWLLTGSTGTTSLSCGKGPGFTSMSLGHGLLLIMQRKGESLREGGRGATVSH